LKNVFSRGTPAHCKWHLGCRGTPVGNHELEITATILKWKPDANYSIFLVCISIAFEFKRLK